MARTQETFNKKEKEKKRLKKREDKQAKKEERRANSDNTFDNMIAYVDENGVISNTPPDPSKKIVVDASNIEIGIPKQEDLGPVIYQGKVDFYNTDKGFGFIKDTKTQDSYFFHVNGLIQPVAEGDLVTFELEKGLKGMNCVRVTK